MVHSLFALGVCLDKTEAKLATETNLWKLGIISCQYYVNFIYIVTWFGSLFLGFIFPYGFKG